MIKCTLGLSICTNIYRKDEKAKNEKGQWCHVYLRR